MALTPQKISARTEMTDPLDDDMMPIVDDPTGTPLDRKTKMRHNRYFGVSIPYFASAALHLSHPSATVTTAGAVGANSLQLHVIVVPYRRAFTSIALFGTVTGGNVRMGIYNSVFSEANGWRAGTLVAETASTAVAANNTITTAAITATLDPGIYFVGAVFDSTPTVRKFAGANGGSIHGVELSSGPNISPAGFSFVHTYGALPDLTGQTLALNTAPVIIGIR